MSGYTNREDYVQDGLECTLADDCQLIAEHAESCDPRREQERWTALHEAFRHLDMGEP
jgi:hypothetical protein